MTNLLEMPVTALRCAAQWVDEDKQRYEGVYTLENHSSTGEPPLDGRWVSLHELTDLSLAVERLRPTLTRYLKEANSLIAPANRRAWHEPGWYPAAQRWMENSLQEKGYALTGSIHQYDSWGLTCLMDVATTDGRIFFKTAPALLRFAHEPNVMAALAKLFPNHVPMPIAVEPTKRWMLLADFGATYYDQAPKTADAAKAHIMRAFANLQIAAIPHREQLLVIGCVDRRLSHLIDDAEALFADGRIMVHLKPEEVEQLRTRLPLLNNLTHKLAQFNIPETLIHGDLGIGNVAGTTAQPIFFDWTEAAVSHPFFDIFDMFFAADSALQMRVRDSYLAAWSAYEPWERLLEAWAIARPLCALYHAISYQTVYNNLESPFQEAMVRFVQQWLRRVLQHTENVSYDTPAQGDAHV
ncbi:MAG: aminoglycoside phosphotransferase family protein [Caldilineaceae bacterium]|nr:aminoglycoside phosphotransferase family protein [Caldilineaceae bacterium]